MNRFFCKLASITGSRIVIDDAEQVHHARVLRVAPGEKAVVCDEQGNEYLCRLNNLMKQKAVFDVVEKRECSQVSLPTITVAVALPKKSKFDDIVDKVTQVGADRIIPLITERVIVKADMRNTDARYARWEKIAHAATLQSQRSRVPCVEKPVKFDRLLEQADAFDLKLIPTLEGTRKKMRDVLRGGAPQNILALIGPEGDFSPTEISAALHKGFVPISFGANVLRVETAAVYVTSMLTYEFR